MSDGAIDWNRFADLTPLPYGTRDGGTGSESKPEDPDNKNRLQLAYRIDTSLVGGLAALPDVVAKDPNILALRNLERGWRMRLPSGQDIARAMGVQPLADSDILIGKFTGDPTDPLVPIHHFGRAFTGNCPLWLYTLAETGHHIEDVPVQTSDGERLIPTPKLGLVGGRIVAETIAGLLLMDSMSFVSLDPLWTPQRDVGEGLPRSIGYAAKDGPFRLRDLIRAALEDGEITAC